jgi:hypothetical protein
VSAPSVARAALVCCAMASAGCSMIGGDTLSDAQQVIANMKSGAADVAADGLKVTGAVDHADRTYRVGEPIVLQAEVNKPAYVAVLRVMPSGATSVVLPNRAQPAAQLTSPLRIPPATASFTIAAETPGPILFEFIGTSRGDSWLFTRKPVGSADFVELGTTTRALASDILPSVRTADGVGTAFAYLAVRVGSP